MPQSVNTTLVSIKFPASSATSEIMTIPDNCNAILGFQIPAGVLGSKFTFNVNYDGSGNVYPLDNSGSSDTAAKPYTVNYTAPRCVKMCQSDFLGVQQIQLISDVAQTASVNVLVLCAGF